MERESPRGTPRLGSKRERATVRADEAEMGRDAARRGIARVSAVSRRELEPERARENAHALGNLERAAQTGGDSFGA
jgi:hypothetical protein